MMQKLLPLMFAAMLVTPGFLAAPLQKTQTRKMDRRQLALLGLGIGELVTLIAGAVGGTAAVAGGAALAQTIHDNIDSHHHSGGSSSGSSGTKTDVGTGGAVISATKTPLTPSPSTFTIKITRPTLPTTTTSSKRPYVEDIVG